MSKFCPNCGNEIEDKDIYCTVCGNEIDNDNDNENLSLKTIKNQVKKKFKESYYSDILINENKKILKNVLGKDGIRLLSGKLRKIEKDEGQESVSEYFDNVINRISYVVDKGTDYAIESQLADSVYKSYITGSISRLDKINGRFMASQTIKLDKIIEQNEIIIKLLKEIRDK